VFPVVACRLELLVLIQRTSVGHELMERRRPMQYALYYRALTSQIVGKIVQPLWVLPSRLGVVIVGFSGVQVLPLICY
jgi:hypothetical protein